MAGKPKTLFAFRLDPGERAHLAQRAADLKVSESELARRYVSEGLRVEAHPGIAFTTGAAGRRAVIAIRPRLIVADVIETWLLEDRDAEATASYFEMEPEQVRAAIAYYADFPEEIDARIAQKRAFAERMERIHPSRRAD